MPNKDEFFTSFSNCRRFYANLRDDEDFQDELKEVFGEDCLSIFDKIFLEELPRQ